MEIWDSRLKINLLIGESLRLSDISCDGDSIYWAESRPAEKGRTTLMCKRGCKLPIELLPPEYSPKCSIHGYGGKAYCVSEGKICFINKHDDILYLREKSGEIIPLLEKKDGVYGGLVLNAASELLFGVREVGEGHDVRSEIFVLDLQKKNIQVLERGADFYANVSYHSASKQVAWLSWNHPHMPWDENVLHCAVLENGQLTQKKILSQGKDVSVFQPQWHPSGDLIYVSNRNGWNNLYRHDGEKEECLYTAEADFGLPLWVLGMSTFGIHPNGDIYAAGKFDGLWKLVHLPWAEKSPRVLETSSTFIDSVAVGKHRIAYLGSSDREPTAVRSREIIRQEEEILQPASSFAIPAGYLPNARSVFFPGDDGTPVQAWYYPATHPENNHASGESPLIVIAHGGPTAAADCDFDPRYLFWTSRGFSILDVNYRGSTGFGSAYQHALRGQWGHLDRLDCEAAARYAVAQGWAHPDKLIIRGSSAGGLTALCCLTFGSVFATGASYYGVSDLLALAQETHRFEAHYTDGLVGKLPESQALYEERSPAFHPHLLTRPIAFFQGEKDDIVPPAQSKVMYHALQGKGIPTLYQSFPEEGHGFRQLDTIKTCLEKELAFYENVLLIVP